VTVILPCLSVTSADVQPLYNRVIVLNVGPRNVSLF
jgi:hypothetical protein